MVQVLFITQGRNYQIVSGDVKQFVERISDLRLRSEITVISKDKTKKLPINPSLPKLRLEELLKDFF